VRIGFIGSHEIAEKYIRVFIMLDKDTHLTLDEHDRKISPRNAINVANVIAAIIAIFTVCVLGIFAAYINTLYKYYIYIYIYIYICNNSTYQCCPVPPRRMRRGVCRRRGVQAGGYQGK
jgi:hypothetical protein